MSSTKSLANRSQVVLPTVVLFLCSALLSACSTLDRYTPVPASKTRDATVLGIANARFFVDQPAAISAEQERAIVREAKALDITPGGTLPTAHLLSLSGGGDNGAFGAGLLVGWTAHGDRPKYRRAHRAFCIPWA
jgi:hypothetical protein